MPDKIPRDIGKEIDKAEPSDEVKRAIARDFEQHANERPIRPDDEAPSHLDKRDNTTRGLNPSPEKRSTRRASDNERSGS